MLINIASEFHLVFLNFLKNLEVSRVVFGSLHLYLNISFYYLFELINFKNIPIEI